MRHFGADLGPVAGPELLPALTSSAPALPLLPAQGDGWYGRAGLSGTRTGEHWAVRWTLDRIDAQATPGAGGTVTVAASDERAGLALVSELAMDAGGLVTLRHTVTNTAATPYRLAGLTCALPVPARAGELLDFTGRWALEKVPQRRAFGHGVWSRENRRGRTGHDAAGLLVAGTEGFGFGGGEVWAVHAGWSGNHVHYAERFHEGVACWPRASCSSPARSPWPRGELPHAAGVLHLVRERPGRGERPAARAPAGRPPAAGPARHAQQLGGHLLRPRPRPAAGAGREGRGGRDRAVRARRRLVPAPPPRPRRARRLVRRRGVWPDGRTRWPTTCASSACSSGSGSSRR